MTIKSILAAVTLAVGLAGAVAPAMAAQQSSPYGDYPHWASTAFAGGR